MGEGGPKPYRSQANSEYQVLNVVDRPLVIRLRLNVVCILARMRYGCKAEAVQAGALHGTSCEACWRDCALQRG